MKKLTITTLSLALPISLVTPVFANATSLEFSSKALRPITSEQVNVNGYAHTLDFKGPLAEMKKLMERAQSQYNKVKQVQAKIDQLKPRINTLQTAVNKWHAIKPSWSMSTIQNLQFQNQLQAARQQQELRIAQSVQNAYEQEKQKELAVLAGLLPELFDKIKSQQRILETWETPRSILPPEQVDELDKILKQVEQLQQEQKKLTARNRPKRELQGADLNESLQKQRTLQQVKQTQQQELKADLLTQEARLVSLDGMDKEIEKVQEEVNKMNGKSTKSRSKRALQDVSSSTTSLVQGKYVKLESVLEKKQEVKKKEDQVKEKLDKAFKEVQEQEQKVDKQIEELKEKIKQQEMEELARKIVKEKYQVNGELPKEQWEKVLELVKKMNEEKEAKNKK